MEGDVGYISGGKRLFVDAYIIRDAFTLIMKNKRQDKVSGASALVSAFVYEDRQF